LFNIHIYVEARASLSIPHFGLLGCHLADGRG